MKKCSKCKRNLSLSKFTKRSDSGKTKGICKDCISKYNKQHYKKHKKKYLTKAKFHRTKDRKRNRNITRIAKERPCTDCGIQYPYYVMQFDHLPEYEKKFTIAHTLRLIVGKDRLLEEIAKCEVVCANCHAERTQQRILAKRKFK